MAIEDSYTIKAREIVLALENRGITDFVSLKNGNELICDIAQALREAAKPVEVSEEEINNFGQYQCTMSPFLSKPDIAKFEGIKIGFRKAMSMNAIARLPTEEDVHKMANTYDSCDYLHPDDLCDDDCHFFQGAMWMRERILGEKK